MRKIAIVNQKGGSGKTTTTVNLGESLASKGKKVLLIDLDPQASTSLWYGFKDCGKNLFDVLTSTCHFSKSVITTKFKGIDIIPSSILLSGAEKALFSRHQPELILKQKLNQCVEKPWDYILVDCPPTLGVLALNALAACEEVLIPVVTHVMALQGLVQLLKTIDCIKEKINPSLTICGILPCRVDARTKHSHQIVNQLQQRFKNKVYKSFIRENIKLAEAPLHKLPISHYQSNCYGTKDYKKLAEELIAKE
jgi:chromosome partitioning protein